jgi:hypothetical protein
MRKGCGGEGGNEDFEHGGKLWDLRCIVKSFRQPRNRQSSKQTGQVASWDDGNELLGNNQFPPQSWPMS